MPDPVRLRFVVRPRTTKHLSLFEDKLRGAGLLVRRVAVLAKDAFDDDPHLSAYVFTNGPVDGDAAAYRLDQLLGDQPQRVIAEHLDGAIVDLQCVVKGYFTRKAWSNGNVVQSSITIKYTAL